MQIRIQDNSLKSLREYFRSKLQSTFTREETDAFFFMGLAHYLNVERIAFYSAPQTKISESDILKFRFLAGELLKNKPIQYIFGETEFMGLKITVNGHVLIPRPETEEMVNDIYSRVKNPEVIIDFCSGSGGIALALKNHFKNANVTGVELSVEALKIAEANAKFNQLLVGFEKDDVLKPGFSIPRADLMVANPPYVTESEKSLMQPNVLDYEPAMALFVPDEDPLKFYKAIIRLNVDNLKPEGWVFLEINEKFGEEVLSLMREAGIVKNLALNHDLNGKPRWVCGQKLPNDRS